MYTYAIIEISSRHRNLDEDFISMVYIIEESVHKLTIAPTICTVDILLLYCCVSCHAADLHTLHRHTYLYLFIYEL